MEFRWYIRTRRNRTLGFLGGRALFPIIIIYIFLHITWYINCSTWLIEVQHVSNMSATCRWHVSPTNTCMLFWPSFWHANIRHPSDTTPTCQQVACWSDTSGTPTDRFLCHVANMLANMSATCWPNKHMSVVLTPVLTCRHPTIPAKVVVVVLMVVSVAVVSLLLLLIIVLFLEIALFIAIAIALAALAIVLILGRGSGPWLAPFIFFSRRPNFFEALKTQRKTDRWWTKRGSFIGNSNTCCAWAGGIFFSTYAVVSVFWLWQEIVLAVTYLPYQLCCCVFFFIVAGNSFELHRSVFWLWQEICAPLGARA